MPKEFIQKLTNNVEASLANEKFGPEDLAREAGMSHSSLNRKLNTITNQSASQFIREIRLKKAKELLQNEEATVAEIAYRVGFGSATYFNKCFHEYFGYAPGEMRNHEEEEPADQPVETVPQKQNRTKIWMVIAFILLVFVPSTYFLIKSIVKDNIKDKSIAVLPFKYLSDNPSEQYLADGLMSAVLNKLSKIKDLRVVSRTSVEQYRESHKSVKDIGREQNVAYLLEGSFQMKNNQVRLILHLIKTTNENHVWSQMYDRQWQDILSVQSEVAETVAGELQAVITPDEKKLIRKIPTTNLTAYDFYQKAIDEMEQYYSGNNRDTVAMKKARYHFQKALELDSTFALAYTGLADIYWEKNYWKTYLSGNFLDSVIILTSKSIAFDNQCAESYYLRGTGYVQLNKLTEASKDLDKAIKYNPNNWKAYHARSYISEILFHDFVGAISNKSEAILRERGAGLPNLLNDIGRSFIDIGFIESGEKYFQQALELTGDSTEYLKWIRYTELWSGNFEKAYQLAKSAFLKDSNNVTDLNTSCIMTGRNKEAYYHFEKLAKKLKKSGEIHTWMSQGIGYTFWLEGRIQEANFYFDQQKKISLESIRLGRANAIQKQAQWDLAKVYAFTGNKEKAYFYLDEVNKKSAFPLWWVTLFKYDPLLVSIRNEPRFHKILQDVEAKYQAEHERVGKWLLEQKML